MHARRGATGTAGSTAAARFAARNRSHGKPYFEKLAADRSDQILAGVVLGTPVSPAMRVRMLFNHWLPWHGAAVALAACLALSQLEMANHVTDANVRVVTYFAAFLAAFASVATLVLPAVGLFTHRAKVRRDAQRQAEAD